MAVDMNGERSKDFGGPVRHFGQDYLREAGSVRSHPVFNAYSDNIDSHGSAVVVSNLLVGRKIAYIHEMCELLGQPVVLA